MDLDQIINYINKGYIVEIRGYFFKHIYELVKILKKLSSKKYTHILIYNSCKYIDVYKLYNELEPYLKQLDNITIFWENDIEALVYHTMLLERTNMNYLAIILPYMSEFVSQIENTYIYKLKKVLKEVVSKGWRVLVINPVLNNSVSNSIHSTNLADITVLFRVREKLVINSEEN